MSEYRPLHDYAMIGNGRTAALVSRHGSIDWCCFPRFDSPAQFWRLLDARKGAFFQVALAEEFTASRSYLPDTNVLATRFHGEDGTLVVTDFLPLPPGGATDQRDLDRGRILRLLEVTEGAATVRVSFRLSFNFGRDVPEFSLTENGCRASTPKESLLLKLPGALLEKGDGHYEALFRMEAGERQWVTLCYRTGGDPADVEPAEAEKELNRTCHFWRDWIGRCTYDGPHKDLVKRSAIVLKSLIYQPTGALIAAPTTSLPERIGGDLNWDYRFAWLRDSGLIIDVLQRLGYHDESIRFLDWIERLCVCSKEHLQPVYSIGASPDLPEEEVSGLDGYRGSRPVRIGNAAAKQFQLDVPGHVLEAAYLCHARMPREMKPELWETLCNLAGLAVRHWQEPDNGIWEERAARHHYIHSKLFCWVAVDRALRAAEEFHLKGPTDQWAETRDAIARTILEQGFDASSGAFRQTLDSTGSDATALVIPLAGLVPASDPRVQSTLKHLLAELTRDGLLYRRRRSDQTPDEGIFLLSNFWLVDVLHASGRRAEASELFERLVAFGNDVGLYPEEIEQETGEWLGNFPQAFTHLGLVRSATNFAEESS